MSLLPKSIHRCRRYPTKFNSGRDIPATFVVEVITLFYIQSSIDSVKGSSWKSMLLTPTEGIIPLE